MTVDQRPTDQTTELTIDQFMDKLESVVHMFVWSFERHRRVGTERRAHPRFSIRGTARRGTAQGLKLNPVEALYHALTGKSKNWKDAGQTLGLSPTDTKHLIAAANHQTWSDRGGSRQPDEHLEWLRMRLLEIVQDETARDN